MDKQMFWVVCVAAVIAGTMAGVGVEIGATGTVTLARVAGAFVGSLLGPAVLWFIARPGRRV
jgi:predicted anti-sigma-YlaC factor YlaD